MELLLSINSAVLVLDSMELGGFLKIKLIIALASFNSDTGSIHLESTDSVLELCDSLRNFFLNDVITKGIGSKAFTK